MTHVTCRLTAKNQDQLWNPMLGNRVWAIFYLLFLLNNYEQLCSRGVYLILKADGRELAKVRSQICTAALVCEL